MGGSDGALFNIPRLAKVAFWKMLLGLSKRRYGISAAEASAYIVVGDSTFPPDLA